MYVVFYLHTNIISICCNIASVRSQENFRNSTGTVKPSIVFLQYCFCDLDTANCKFRQPKASDSDDGRKYRSNWNNL